MKRNIFIFLIAIVLVTSLSWFVTCEIVKLITICLGLNFSWSMATGIWLLLCLLGSFTKGGNK